MLYVSQFDRRNNIYGVTDTDDGVTQPITANELLHIVNILGVPVRGVKGNNIEVVSITNQILKTEFGGIQAKVNAMISTWYEETCMAVARSAHFVRQIKGLPIEEMRKVTASYVYPKSVADAVRQAQQYTNQVHEVSVADKEAVKNALRNNVCLVLQQKTNGTLTSFICTGSFAVQDKIYEPGFFETVYLTKQLYNYTYNIEKVRPAREEDPNKVKNPSLLNVMSCALRFRNDGVHHDKGNMVLSSPFYTINLDKLFSMYILDNPSTIGNTIVSEFHKSKHLGTYDFDFDMWKDILQCCEDGTNYFGNHDKFMSYVNTEKLTKGVEVNSIISRFQADFDYIEWLRGQGYSFRG